MAPMPCRRSLFLREARTVELTGAAFASANPRGPWHVDVRAGRSYVRARVRIFFAARFGGMGKEREHRAGAAGAPGLPEKGADQAGCGTGAVRTMLTHILTIARNTFLESVRQPIYFILISLCGLAILFTTWTAAFSMGYTDSAEVSGDNKMLLEVGLATVFVSGILLAAFLATAVISKEIERKTVLTVVSKPVARTSVVLGKYLGVAGAIAIAGTTMVLFLFMGIRHEVMSTAADKLDGPVLVFGGLAIGLAVLVGVWCNFFYGWSFTQVCTMTLFPLMIAAYVGVLLIGKDWKFQTISENFKPQIAMAAGCVVLSQLVLTSVAVAASARLGQVMTLVVCCGVFLGGLVSNYFIGRHAIENEFVGRIAKVAPESSSMDGLTKRGDRYKLTLELEPRIGLKPGSPVYYGPNPSGWAMVVSPFAATAVDVNSLTDMSSRERPAALVIVSQTSKDVLIQRIGADDAGLISRPPQAQDYVFLHETKINPLALGVWGVVPNVQSFWLVDAVTQNAPIPARHVGLVALYALMQIGVFLSLAVVMFQTREVG